MYPCYRLETVEDDVTRWERWSMPYLVDRGGQPTLELPKDTARATVNGLAVAAGTHAVTQGDLVHAWVDGEEIDCVVGRPEPVREPGQGRCCRYTGLVITGEAVRCPMCDGVVSAAAAEELGKCPCCGIEFAPASPEPPEELQ